MATIKAYTDLNQSKKLAEILPLESADMRYNDWTYDFYDGYEHTGKYVADLGAPKTICGKLDIPCWSLAALLDQLPDEFIDKEGNIYCLDMNKEEGKYQLIYNAPAKGFVIETEVCDNFVDACYELVLKLHELKIL